MKEYIKKLLREGLEGLTPEDLNQINQIVNREMIQAKEQQEKLKDELETTHKVLDSILTAMASGKLEGVPTDYILDMKKDKENRIHQLEKYIIDHVVWCNLNSANQLATEWKNVLTYMWSRDDSHHLAEFKKIMLVLDQHRKESLIDVLPHLADLL
jgi:hypothetical protein